jgi:hypothetical protein
MKPNSGALLGLAKINIKWLLQVYLCFDSKCGSVDVISNHAIATEGDKLPIV